MSRKFTPKIISANALLEGDVIYFTADDKWTRDHAKAEFIEDEAHAQIRMLDAETDGSVVGAFLADARQGMSGPEPVHFREEFRARGPSNYFHGKQENENNV